MDRRLPLWARRTNPVIRRHLGGHWRALPLETDLLLRIVSIQLVFIAASLLIPGLFVLMFMVLPVSLVLLPFLFMMYVRMAANIGRFTAEMIVSEHASGSFELLRVTPISLRHILYSKAAAGVWRYVEDFGLIIVGGALLSLPVLSLVYAPFWTLEYDMLGSRLLVAAALLTSVLRLVLEPIMVASVAVLVGISVPWRAPALMSLLAMGFFYILLMNLPRLLPLSLEMHFVVDCVLPLAVPLLVIFGAFRLSEHLLRRD